MPRVLHLITRYLDGGAETTTRNTLNALAAADREYDLYLGTGAEHDGERLAEVEAAGIATVVFRTMRHYNPVAAVFAVVAVAWFLAREEVDVLHTHSTEAGIVGRLAGFLARTPTVVHEIHNDPIAPENGALINLMVRVLEHVTAPLADVLIVKSPSIRRKYLDRGIGTPDQYELIYHGVPTEAFARVEPGRTDGDGPVTLLFVGRLVDGKGLFDLLDAFERLEGAELDIVGDGPLYDDLADAVDHRDLDGVSLLGYRDDVPAVMARSDVLVLPSYREGTPRVITEAMASGLPVVSTDIAGIPDQVADDETGYLIEPGDVDALVEALRALIDDPERRRTFGERARDRVERFDVDTAKENYRELYRRIAD